MSEVLNGNIQVQAFAVVDYYMTFQRYSAASRIWIIMLYHQDWSQIYIHRLALRKYRRVPYVAVGVGPNFQGNENR